MPHDSPEVFFVCSCYGESIQLSDWKAVYPDNETSMDDDDDLIISIWSQGVRRNHKRGFFRRLRLAFRFIISDNLYSDEIILSKHNAISMANWICDRYYEIPSISELSDVPSERVYETPSEYFTEGSPGNNRVCSNNWELIPEQE